MTDDTGSCTIRVSDIVRNQQTDDMFTLDSGAQIVMSLNRAPLCSPELAITLKVCYVLNIVLGHSSD